MARLTGPDIQITDGTDPLPVASGNVYFSEPGTTTEKTVYSDAALSTAISQPITLNSEGRFSTDIYGDGAFRVECYDSTDTGSRDGVQVFDVDNVRGPEDFSNVTLTAPLKADDSTSTALPVYTFDGDADTGIGHPAADTFTGSTGGTERWRTTVSGDFLVSKTTANILTAGAEMRQNGLISATRSGGEPLNVDRLTNDGDLVVLRQDGTNEGSISVSGTTVSYNGAHLSRWSQWEGAKFGNEAGRPEVPRGTILSNRDEMCRWKHLRYQWVKPEPTKENPNATVVIDAMAQYGGVAEDGEQSPHEHGGEHPQSVTATVHEESNEQLNRVAISEVAGDRNVAGVFQGYDEDDDTQPFDFYVAMTGDFIIRIGAGVVVSRGDLIESAGDGTGKPQADDAIRSSTVAKVTSTHVTCTYQDGSYCVPCVLMAC